MPVGPLAAAQLSTNRRQLFLIGFLTLFLELACIRWFAAYVIFLQFFTNFILIASFLGLSIGCVCAGARPDWLRRFPGLSLTAMGLAMGFHFLYRRWRGLAIDVGGQRTSPQLVFFGTEFRDMDVARFVVPMELIAALFFVLVTLLFIGLGQLLARGLDQEPSRIAAYIANIAGSLAGILAFAIASFVNAPPIVWFLIGFTGVGYLLHVAGKLTRAHVVLLALTAVLILLSGLSLSKRYEFAWSPYYWIRYAKGPRVINVNNISHQQLVPNDQGPVYSLIHLLQRDAGAPPFEHVLIIGAGGGNDVAHALRNHVKHVDAVEIDPVINVWASATTPSGRTPTPGSTSTSTTGVASCARRPGSTTWSSTPSWIHSSFTAATATSASRAFSSPSRRFGMSRTCSSPMACSCRTTSSARAGSSSVSRTWSSASSVRRR
jgi:hypothetical protein